MKKININQIRNISIAIILIAIMLLLFSCNKTTIEPNKEKTANDYIYEAFQEWYLWYEQLPEINPNDFLSYDALIDTLAVDVDRWSFAGSYNEINSFFEAGEYTGFGGGTIYDYDEKLKISHVFKNSPWGKMGVERGWIFESINGYTLSDTVNFINAMSAEGDLEFVFTTLTNEKKTITVKREPIVINTVLHSEIKEYDAHKIGYLVFSSFLGTSEAELKTAFKEFEDQKITDLIVDLRYNGGGSGDIANMLIGMIGGAKVSGKIIEKTEHNNKKSNLNESSSSTYNGAKVNIDKVYFITTSGSASASELVINCLEPYMDVKLVGSSTSGKPVGMYIFSVKEIDLAILPICIKYTNSIGYGDYYNGIPVDISEADDLSHNWGDPEEAMLKAAIKDILEPDVIAFSGLKSAKINKQKLTEHKGINQIINAY